MKAQYFFKLLKMHGNPLLLDTRRNPSYRTSKFADQEDLIYFCEVHDVPYQHELSLAPTLELRQNLHKVLENKSCVMKDRAMAWTEFLQGYSHLLVGHNKVLRTGNPLRKIVDGTHESIAIMCACGHHQDCHRQATAGLLGQWIKGVRVVHLDPSMMGGEKPSLKSPRRYLVRNIPSCGLVAYPPRGWTKSIESGQ